MNQLVKIYNGSDENGTLLSELAYYPIEEKVLYKKDYHVNGSVSAETFYISQEFVRVISNGDTTDYSYVYHDNHLVAQEIKESSDETKLFVHTDHLGSSKVVTDEDGIIVEKTRTAPFGEVITGGRLSRYGYEAKEHETGLGKITTDELSSYYAFEGDATDEVSNVHGTIQGATRTDAKVRDGYSFDGVDDYINFSSEDFPDDRPGSISMWVKMDTRGMDGDNYSFFSIATSDSGYNLLKYGTTLFFNVADSIGTRCTHSITDWHIGEWHHIAMTWDGTFSYGYEDGVQVCGIRQTLLDATSEMRIGTFHSSRFYLDGSVDEFGVWNKLLTSDEVEELTSIIIFPSLSIHHKNQLSLARLVL